MARGARWTESETIQLGKDLVGIAKELQARLADRDISAEFLAECERAIASAEGAATGQPVLLGTQKGTTLALEDVLATISTRVMAVRAAIKRVHPKREDIHRAFGVGSVDAGATVKGARSAIEAVLKGAETYPAETASARVIARDLDGLRSLRERLSASDRVQESAKGAKKSGTAARDARLRELTRHLDVILAAAALEFAEEPATLERFTTLIPTKKKARKERTEG